MWVRGELAREQGRPAGRPGSRSESGLRSAEVVDLRGVEEAHPRVECRSEAVPQAGLAQSAGIPPVGPNADGRHADARIAKRPCDSQLVHRPPGYAPAGM